MIFLHVLGGLIVVVGLALFVLNQVKPHQDHEDESTVNVWKINLSGPPALVLILVGVLVFVFPFTTFYKSPTDPNPPVATTVQVNTTLNNPATSFVTTTTLIPEIGLPLAPDSYEIVFDEDCGADAIVWNQPDIENVRSWWLSFESYTAGTDEVFSTFEIDTEVDPLTFGNVSAICSLDFLSDEPLDYYIWVYAYNDAGFSEPLFIEYLGA